jgi:hypothetical protein
VILQPHKNFLYCNGDKCEKNQNDKDVKIKKNDKMQHKFTYFGVQIRTFNSVTPFLVYDLVYSLNSVQSFNEFREREKPVLSSPALCWGK